MRFVIFGLTVTSSWGNGHATLWRSLLKAMSRRGHTAAFYEKNVSWYADARGEWAPSAGVALRLYDPLNEIEHAAGDLLLFQSMQRGSREIAPVALDYDFDTKDLFDDPGYSKMHFIEHRYAHDETNWWVPNRACVEAMLRSSGFSIESQPEEEVYLCRWQQIENPPDGPPCVYPARGPRV